ncbi:helix-turn-helix domain-containing protein [Pontibacter korlensis]|uniref:DNA-binding protein n=1 Tax=Pontibacter korlensis TaxID=400092 RepID=A0A0E3ZFI1_9BACT|nr:helix-turn-helix domain-containing protein [Pontibacter korlensis]AKD04359.1 DNA-binding protein [Pontibacter korlensis]
METLTFEQLPQAICQLHEKISKLEQLLQERQNPQHVEEMFTVEQAAAFLNLTITTLHRKVSSRQIPSNKSGNRLYFYKSELEAWIKGGRKKTLAELQLEAQEYTRKKPKHKHF